MTDAAFTEVMAFGVASPDDLQISAEERDADPLQCDGERFFTLGTVESWVVRTPQ